MSLEFQKIYGIGCTVCGCQSFGPNDGTLPDSMSYDNIWYTLRCEAESSGWFTVGRGDCSALVCSPECANRWLNPDNYDEDGTSLHELHENYKRRVPAVRNALASLDYAQAASFTARDIYEAVKYEAPGITPTNVSSMLKSLVKKGTLSVSPPEKGRAHVYRRLRAMVEDLP